MIRQFDGLRLALAAGAALALFLGLQHTAHAAVHRAALVVEHSGGGVLARCVSFMSDQISGFQLIASSGLEYHAQSFGSMGEAICQLDYEPAQVPSNCFGSGAYWQYFHRTTGGWAQSGVGASGWMLHDGDMDGWHYATGAGQAPPPLTFAQVCGAPAAAPTRAPARTVAAAPAIPTHPSAALAASPPAPAQIQAPAASPTSARVDHPQTTVVLPKTGAKAAAVVATHPPWVSIGALVAVIALLTGLAVRMLVIRPRP